MIGVVLRRIAWSIVTVWFVITLAFAALMAIPADPAKALLGPHADAASIERVRAHYCLDRDVLGRYGCFVGNLLRGDLGDSFRSKRPVADIIADRIGPTVQLALAAIALQLVIGLPLGVYAARRRGQFGDRAVSAVTLLAASAPSFVVGTVLLYLLAYLGGAFPLGGYGEGGLDRLWHLCLPAMTLALTGVAYYARVMRSELGEALEADFVRTARAKGLAERAVVWRHGVRSSLGAIVTLVGLDLGILLGGAVVTEAIFAWPGLGREVLQAILELDVPLILGVVLVAATAIVVANMVVDVLYRWLDPRVRGDDAAGSKR